LNFFSNDAPSQIGRFANANEDRMGLTSAATSIKGNSLFPAGYVPPHLAKTTAHDGLTSDQHLRFQANQTKK
jgi:hypothetical protein